MFFTPQLYGTDEGRENDPTRTNLEIIQGQLSSITKELAKRAGLPIEGALYVKMQNSETSWVVQNTVLEALKGMGFTLLIASTDSKSPGRGLEFGLLEVKVTYGPTFRESFLGKRKSLRSIKTAISASVRSTGDEILFAGDLTRTYSDTVRASDIKRLENPGHAITHGEPPADGVFDSVIEPAVIIGATAVAVYLFFTVRS